MQQSHAVTMLALRAHIVRKVREFFWSQQFIEVETPVALACPSQEPYLEPLRTTIHDVRGRAHDAFLRMSPEFSLKKVMAAGVDRVFEIGPVFRDGEPWGDTHNPEFTMIEWYRAHADYRQLMRDGEALVHTLLRARRTLRYQDQIIDCATPWERLTMRQAWRRYARLDLDGLLTRTAMARACRAKGYTVTAGDTFDDLFFKIHLSEVEPKLGRARPTFLTDWPASMAALARKKSRDPRYAERVELYLGGLELANGFSELTDADEQLARFREDQRLRKRLGRTPYPIDHAFIAALRRMPPTAGIALGIDRLVMLLCDAATVDEVRWLPTKKLWETPGSQ
ncbi:EF-P lysine aminoacylase GenX [Candidatus Uhrbacteria bacterium]|nr:EF-P lysine aminoacylase GenX [Candidatus Uhrbacteria bacterium]